MEVTIKGTPEEIKKLLSTIDMRKEQFNKVIIPLQDNKEWIFTKKGFGIN